MGKYIILAVSCLLKQESGLISVLSHCVITHYYIINKNKIKVKIYMPGWWLGTNYR